MKWTPLSLQKDALDFIMNKPKTALLASPGLRGVPDQIVMFPGVICFVELKAPGELPRPQQVLRHNDLTSLGFQVEVVDDYRGVDKLVNALCLESLG